jgi:Ran GTPase-activating protein 1
MKVFEALGKGESRNVEVLRLQYNDINSQGAKSLLQAVRDGMPNLRRVEINGNKFYEDDLSIQALADMLSERKDADGKDDDPDDFWGLDELDELEEESSEDEEDEEADEQEDLEERILEEAEELEDKPVAQKRDPDVDELADALKKTGI